ncbi:ABC transporter substrate-binding protein [Nocardia sp. AG03]|uniref:ABC transporter substrate-binding protein n=1 Tax=Nocardia sp. AG03 TaxID=3025312 RepID=UPI00241859E2|nr:ABC transporter substrate-binding protein [Nocardia sp. AG03]
MSKRRISVIVAVLASMILTSTACVKSDNDTHEVFNDPDGTPGFSLPAQPRVVALGWSDGAVAAELGVPPVAIYDWMNFGADTKGVGEWDVAAMGTASPELLSSQSAGEFNMQQIEELKPDLILNVRAKADDDITTNLSKIAPVVTAPDDTGDYAVNWQTQARLIGAALGKRAEADKLVLETTTAQQAVRAGHPEFEGKTFVYAAKFGTAYGAYLPGDARFDFFAELGFVPNPAVTRLQSSGFFAQVPVERVGDLDAQAALFTTITLPFTDLENDTLINSLAVVRDGRALMLPENDPAILALSAGTPKSLALALERITPQLSAITAAR